MNAQELKEYMTRAKDLEAAIFTQQEFITAYQTYSEENAPKRPVMERTAFNYIQPKYPERKMTSGGDMLFLTVMGLSFAAFVGMALFSLFADDIDTSMFLLCTILSVGTGFLFSSAFDALVETKKKYTERIKEYNKELEKYTSMKAQWEAGVERSKQEYEEAEQVYEVALKEYQDAYQLRLSKHKEALRLLVNTLKDHYANGSVFEKYRSFAAIATMTEYLQSGRCSTLEGADGAYNMYELELRQNIVIGQLSTIISNLEQIKNNQYTLYQEIIRANCMVSELMGEIREMNSTAKETAYFAGVTALVAASPKITYGFVF